MMGYLDQDICRVCGKSAKPYDCCDFNKSCEEARGLFVPLSLRPVYYYRCTACGFVFAPEICSWSKEQFRDEIYNEEYIRFDPDFVEIRPAANAGMLSRSFHAFRERLKILDYGGGQGRMADLLSKVGFDASCYDPFYDEKPDQLAADFDLITAFEVFEHTTAPRQLVEDVVGFLKPDGVFLFSTLVSDGNIKENSRLSWWYASPRNGHISIFTQKSLQLLGDQFGFQLLSFSPGVHAFFKKLPVWAKEVFYPAKQA